MYSRRKPILPTRSIFRKQPHLWALISGASRGRLQEISRQSFAIFNLFRTEVSKEGNLEAYAHLEGKENASGSANIDKSLTNNHVLAN